MNCNALTTNAMSDFQFESVIQSGKVSYLQVVSGYTTVRGIGKKLGPNLNFLSMENVLSNFPSHPSCNENGSGCE